MFRFRRNYGGRALLIYRTRLRRRPVKRNDANDDRRRPVFRGYRFLRVWVFACNAVVLLTFRTRRFARRRRPSPPPDPITLYFIYIQCDLFIFRSIEPVGTCVGVRFNRDGRNNTDPKVTRFFFPNARYRIINCKKAKCCRRGKICLELT